MSAANEKGPQGDEALEGLQDGATSPESYAAPAELATQADPELSLRFLQWFAPKGPWMLWAKKVDEKKYEAMTFWPGKEDRVRTWLRNVGDWTNQYFCVNPVRELMVKKPAREDIGSLAWLHVDVDPRPGKDLDSERKMILAKLQAPPNGIPRPSCVIFSGGGYQAFWRLREPFAINGEEALYEEAKLYNKKLELVLGGDDCHNVDRVMRLPGSVNRPEAKKRAKGRRAELARVEWMEDTAYDLAQFEKAPSGNVAGSKRKRAAVEVSGEPKNVDLGTLPVGDLCKRVIAQGCDPDDPTRFAKKGSTELDRSRALCFVCRELVRTGVDDDTIFSVIMDPVWGISACVLDKPDPRAEAVRQIEKAHEDEDGDHGDVVHCASGMLAENVDKVEHLLVEGEQPIYQRGPELVQPVPLPRVGEGDEVIEEEGVRRRPGAVVI